MKKILLFCALCLLSVPVMADQTCNGGTLVTANSETDTDKGCTSDTCKGHTFCKSSGTMTWWAAWAWCESQRRNLAEISVMCPARSSGACPNLKGVSSGWAWSKTPSGNNSLSVNLSSGSVYYDGRYGDNLYAFCE